MRHRGDGTPVLSVDGHELVHRVRSGDSYFRLQLVCSVCGRTRVTWRGARITSAADLATVQPGEVTCDPCLEDRLMAHADDAVVRARFTHRTGKDRRADG